MAKFSGDMKGTKKTNDSKTVKKPAGVSSSISKKVRMKIIMVPDNEDNASFKYIVPYASVLKWIIERWR